MYPIGSNGASQAILDSAHLARCLEQYGPSRDALHHYEKIRRVSVNKIVETNRLDGPDKILDIVAEKAPNGFENINDVMPHKKMKKIAEKYKVIAGFDADTLNSSNIIME